MYVYRSFGVVSDKLAQLSATPYKRYIFKAMRGREAKVLAKSWKPRSFVSVGIRVSVAVRGAAASVSARSQTSLCAVFAARSIAPCVARSLSQFAQTSLCAVFAAISAKTRQNLAVRGLCSLSRFRPSFRIVLAGVCGPECRKTSLCAVFLLPDHRCTHRSRHPSFVIPSACQTWV